MLTVRTIHKIEQLTLIEKKLNHTTVKLLKDWNQKIDFFKCLRKNANKKRYNKITKRINELKSMIKNLTNEKNKFKNDVIKFFSVTTNRIFVHNENNFTKRTIHWVSTTNSIAKILKMKNAFSTQIFIFLLSSRINKSKLMLKKSTRALSTNRVEHVTYKNSSNKKKLRSAKKKGTLTSVRWHRKKSRIWRTLAKWIVKAIIRKLKTRDRKNEKRQNVKKLLIFPQRFVASVIQNRHSWQICRLIMSIWHLW